MSARYTHTAITLHWLIALLVFAAFPLGLYMHDLPLSPYKLRLYSYHKWLGVCVMLFVVIRLLWRVTHRPPALPDSMRGWEKLVAESMHYLLYILLFAIPLSGWLMSSAKGFQTVLFGMIPLPDLLNKDKFLGEFLQQVHESFNWILLIMVCAHVTASLKHHFIERDDVLQRMLPLLGRKP